MADTVIQSNSGSGTEAEMVPPRLPPVDPVTITPTESGSGVSTLSETLPRWILSPLHRRRRAQDASTLSEMQAAWLRPEFTQALVEHMHEAKQLAILGQRE